MPCAVISNFLLSGFTKMGNNLVEMTIVVLLLRLIVFYEACLCGASSGNQRGLASNVELQYPNLYFGVEDLRKLRAQAAGSHAEIYQLLVEHVRGIQSEPSNIPPNNASEFNARWNEKYGNVLAPLALYCVLTPQDEQALDLAKLFMERLTTYDTWLVRGREDDEVPLSHTIVGYATAFDCLHNFFTLDERLRYAAKLEETGAYLSDASNKWWGNAYIQNHVATNYMALLTAALVLKPYYPTETLGWEVKSLKALDGTMKFLQLVVDGSFEEGVTYGTYTMRSLTQFMLISKRHFARDYSANNWLREHFHFLLHTIIPGYQFTVGFADGNLNWAYGPESHLAFLESYVNRDGRANWLHDEIRQRRRKREEINRKSVIHTEFLFYNNSFRPKPSHEAKLHVFSDWGVITYGGGVPRPHVFLALKCGHLHGRAINLLRPNLNIDTLLNPGHEHPDQGSFVFVTKDQAVVTEPRYGPKYTYLQNTLMFAPASAGCTPPFLGQLGECGMWFNYFDERAWVARADLVGYSREDDIIFMSGEMTQVYDGSLGLTNVYRALIMLTPTVLVVIDIVRFRADSVTTHASAFFHNSDFVFNINENGENPCASVGRYQMCWRHLNAETVDVHAKNNVKKSHMRYPTNFVNVTWKRSKPLTSTAYVFHGPKDSLKDLKLSEINDTGITVNLTLNSLRYDIILTTRHDDPRVRRKLLRSNGYGKVYVRSNSRESVFHLGVNRKREAQIPRSQVAASDGYSVHLIEVITLAAILCFCGKYRTRRRFNKCVRLIAFCLIFAWSASLYLSVRIPYKHLTKTRLHPYSTPPVLSRANELSAVLITGLPLGGEEIAREMFTTNRDFITIDVPSGRKINDKKHLDFCKRTETENFTKWWDAVLNAPVTLSKTMTRQYVPLANPLDLNSFAGTYIDKSPGSFAAVRFKNPRWLYGIPESMRNAASPFLYIVRDPRKLDRKHVKATKANGITP